MEFSLIANLINIQSSFNYTSLLVSIIIKEEFVQKIKQIIIQNSEEEKEFINELKIKISNIDTTNILNNNTLKCVTQEFATMAENLCNKYSKLANITIYSKA